MTHTDLKNIFGAKEGTFEYYHEEGHIKFNEKYSSLIVKSIYLDYIFRGGLAFSLLFIFLNLVILSYVLCFVSIVSFLISVGLDMFEEKICNNYARKKVIYNERH